MEQKLVKVTHRNPYFEEHSFYLNFDLKRGFRVISQIYYPETKDVYAHTMYLIQKD
jgi:hypothetical protein